MWFFHSDISSFVSSNLPFSFSSHASRNALLMARQIVTTHLTMYLKINQQFLWNLRVQILQVKAHISTAIFSGILYKYFG